MSYASVNNYSGSNTGAGGITSCAVTTTSASGNLLIAHVTVGANLATSPTFATPSGWTNIPQATTAHIATYYKANCSANENPTFTWTNGGTAVTEAIAMIAEVSGTGSTFVITGSATTGTSSPMASFNISAQVGDFFTTAYTQSATTTAPTFGSQAAGWTQGINTTATDGTTPMRSALDVIIPSSTGAQLDSRTTNSGNTYSTAFVNVAPTGSIRSLAAYNNTTNNGGANVTSISVTTTSTSGNMLIAHVTIGGNNPTQPTWNTPSGWTNVSAATGRLVATYYKANCGANEAPNFTWTNGSTAATIAIVEVNEVAGAGATPTVNGFLTTSTNSPMTVTLAGINNGDWLTSCCTESANSAPTFGNPSTGWVTDVNTTQTDGVPSKAMRSWMTAQVSGGGTVTNSQTTSNTANPWSFAGVQVIITGGNSNAWYPYTKRTVDTLLDWAPIQGIDEPAKKNEPVLKTIQSGMVQKADARNSNSALQQTIGFTSNVTANNLVIAAISTNRAAGPTTLSQVSNSQGDNLVQAGSYQSQGNVTVSLWYVQVRSTGPMSVSYTPANAAASAVSILEYTGFKTLDGTAQSNSAAANLWSLAAIPVTANSDLVVAAFANNNIGNVMTAKGGFTLESDPANTSVACSIYVMDCVASADIIAAGTNGTTDNYCAVGASFQTFTPSVPSAWQPWWIKPWPLLPEPEPWYQTRSYPMGVFPKGVFNTWSFPLGRKFQEPLPETEPARPVAQFPTVLKSAQSTLVQVASTRFAQSASARTQAYSSNVTAGNLLVVCVTTFDPSLLTNNSISVSDTLNNNWQAAATVTSGAGRGLVSVLFYTVSHYSGADTVTVTNTKNVFTSVGVLEYSGNTGLLDSAIFSSGAVTSSPNNLLPNSAIPVGVNAASDLVVAFFSANDTVNSFSALEGFVLQANPVNAADNAALYVMDMSASAPIRAWMNNSTAGISYTAIVVSFFSGSSLPTHPYQSMGSKWFAAVEEPYLPWQGRIMPAALLPGFTQTGSPWGFPKTIKSVDPIPEPPPWHQTRLLSPVYLTGGVNPNPSPWQPFAQRNWPTLEEPVISQGLTEPARRWNPGGLFPGFTKPVSFNLVPWDHNQTPVTQRHQRLVCQILNGLIQVGDILQTQQPNARPVWHLSYNAEAPINWAGIPPATIKEALDRIVAALVQLGKTP